MINGGLFRLYLDRAVAGMNVVKDALNFTACYFSCNFLESVEQSYGFNIKIVVLQLVLAVESILESYKLKYSFLRNSRI